MPDSVPAGTGRQCPKCRRRVPRSVAKCRCGADLPVEFDAVVDDDATSESGRPVWPTYVVLALLLGGVAYWTFGRSAPSPPVTAATAEPATTPTATEAAPPPAPAAKAAPTRELSAEQRAWDNLAKLQGTAPPGAGATAAPASGTTAVPSNPAPSATPGSLEDMVDRAMPAIVLVETSTGRGSAFFVQYDTLITNVHVVQNDAYVTLRKMDGTSVNARVHTRAPAFDIAVLKVAQASSSQPALPMGTARSLKPGQEVIVIGSALGTLQNSVSRGIVSGMRNSSGVTLIQSDAAANPGNSGGPMLDRDGRVVGILTAGYRGQEGLNFAVSIDHARDILEGRQANLGSGQTGLNIQPAAPGGDNSESERLRKQGEQEFSQRVASAEQGANQLDDVWKKFRSQCYQSPLSGSYDREWFRIFTPGGMPDNSAAGCIAYYQSMSTEMNNFRDYMRQTLQAARRANLLPGTIRDTLRSKRLQSDAWDR